MPLAAPVFENSTACVLRRDLSAALRRVLEAFPSLRHFVAGDFELKLNREDTRLPALALLARVHR